LNIRKKTISGLKWATFSKSLSQLVTWSITLIVIRILSPEDYGLMALATILIGFLSILYEMGLGSAIIQAKEINKDSLKNIFGFVLIINSLLWLLSIALAYPISAFFNEPQLVVLIHVLSIKFILIAFSVIPSSLLIREMDFKKKSLVDLVAAITSSITTLIFALSGFGIWSLIGGNIIGSVIALAGLYYVRPYFETPSFNFKKITKHMYFGGIVTLERILWFLYSQADNIIIGKLLGKQSLGMYSVAMDLSSLPMQKLNAIINQVAFPAFSKLQEGTSQLSYAMSTSVRYIGLLSFPIFFGLFITAEEFVPTVLGEKWNDVTLPIMILSLVMPIRMLSNIYPTFLRGIGKPEISLTNLLISMAIMPLSFYLGGTRWGLEGICYAWLLSYPIVFAIETIRTFRAAKIPLYILFKETHAPAIASLIMVMTVYLQKHYVVIENDIINLIAEILSGGLVFIICLLLIDKNIYKDTKVLIKGT
jgi:O-antigen/teichoic acid export membrane protein